MTVAVASAALDQSISPAAPVHELIPWLLGEDQQLRGIAFRDVIFETTGKKSFEH